VLKLAEKHFCLICVAATLGGLFVPVIGRPFVPYLSVLLMGILYLTCLKLDLARVASHLGRPARLVWMVLLVLVAVPFIEWGLAAVFVPGFALGVLLLASMPSGMATASLIDVSGGDTELGLVMTTVTSLVCPVTVPLLMSLASPETIPPSEILRRVGMLAIYILAPGAAAVVTRRLLPKWVERNTHNFTGGAIVALGLLIVAAMSKCSEPALADPLRSLGLLLFLSIAFTALLSVIGYFAIPRARLRERKALAVSTGYVNNALAIVFAAQFYPDEPEVQLPAVILELPMVLAVAVVKRIGAKEEGEPPAEQESSG